MRSRRFLRWQTWVVAGKGMEAGSSPMWWRRGLLCVRRGPPVGAADQPGERVGRYDPNVLIRAGDSKPCGVHTDNGVRLEISLVTNEFTAAGGLPPLRSMRGPGAAAAAGQLRGDQPCGDSIPG